LKFARASARLLAIIRAKEAVSRLRDSYENSGSRGKREKGARK
jgi:hypothetical protein